MPDRVGTRATVWVSAMAALVAALLPFAARDRVPQVKKSAQDGLDAIERRRGGQEGDAR